METYTLPATTALGLVRLRVAELDRSLAFYAGLLGLRPGRAEGGLVALGAADGPPLLELELRPGARPRPRRSTGLYHAAILLPGRPALAQMLRRLAETGYPLSGASDHGVSEALYLDDPDGNGLEIYADRPRDQWPRAGQGLRMSVDPLDIDGLIGELRDAPQAWPGAPAGTTLGHMHLHVADLAAAEAFYVGLLGFEVMQRFGDSALFVSAGGYHHHLGLNTWAGPGAPPPPEDAAGLSFFTVRLPDAAALDALLERARAAGQPLEQRADGFLLRDPSQNGLVLSVV